MTMKIQPRPSEKPAFHRVTTADHESGCTRTDAAGRSSEPADGRRLSVVPTPHARSAEMYVELMAIEPGRPGSEQDGRVARSRSARRAATRRARVAARTTARTEHGDLLHREAGMATAEYAIATLAAVGFAALLVAVLSSGQIKGLLTSLITSALNFG